MLRIGGGQHRRQLLCITSHAVSTVSSEKYGCSPGDALPPAAQPSPRNSTSRMRRSVVVPKLV